MLQCLDWYPLKIFFSKYNTFKNNLTETHIVTHHIQQMLIVCHFASDFLIFFKDKNITATSKSLPYIPPPSRPHRYECHPKAGSIISKSDLGFDFSFCLDLRCRIESIILNGTLASLFCPHEGPVLFYFFIPLILIHYPSSPTHKNNHIDVSDISYLYTYKIYIAFL